MLDKAIRELDRERMALQNQEKKVIAEIKKTAKQGQMVRLQRSISNHHIASFSLTVCLHAGCCQSYGQILGQEQTCSHKDVWSQVTIASSLTAHTGKVSGFAAELLLALTTLLLLTAADMSPADSQVHSSNG